MATKKKNISFAEMIPKEAFKTKKTKKEMDLKEEVIRSFFGGKDIFSTFMRSKFSKTKGKKSVGEQDSPSTEDGESASISKDSLVFLKIIAQNSIALPGMARDINVLRQNVVKLVKLESKKSSSKFTSKSASTKADSFFKTEEKREAELEASRKKQQGMKATAVSLIGKDEKSKLAEQAEGSGSGILSTIWGMITSLGSAIVFGIMAAIGSAISFGSDIGKWFEENFKPMEWMESFWNSIKESWKKLTETDFIKETLIKGVGAFLGFITGGLFGEKELRESLGKLEAEIKPIITFMVELFAKVRNWLAENVGWDEFVIPLSKFSFTIPFASLTSWLPDGFKADDRKINFPDIRIPGFRPFKKEEAAGAGAEAGTGTGTGTETGAGGASGGGLDPTTAAAAMGGVDFGDGRDGTSRAAPSASTSSYDDDEAAARGGVEAPSTPTPTPTAVSATSAAAVSTTPTPAEKVLAPYLPQAQPFNQATTTVTETISGGGETRIEGMGQALADEMRGVPKAQRRQVTTTRISPQPRTTISTTTSALSPSQARATSAVDDDWKNASKLEDDEWKQGRKEEREGFKLRNQGGQYSEALTPEEKAARFKAQEEEMNKIDLEAPIKRPSEDTMKPITAGAGLGQLSSDVAEGQRMDSAPGTGNVVNESTVNNANGTMGKEDNKIADAYNSSFVDSYLNPQPA